MNSQHNTPQSLRAKIVYLFWHNLPRIILLIMIALIVVLSGIIKREKTLIAADKAASISQERPPVNTVLFELQPTSIHDRINLPGSVEPWTKLELMAKVSGSIEKVLVKEGDKVTKGDVLAEIEADDFKIALNRAMAAYKLAKAEYARDRAVYTKGVIPTAELEEKETTMRLTKADVENAQLMLSRCTITAPMDSVIRRLDAKIGLFLSVGDPIAEMLHIDKVKGVVGIPESDIPAIRKLQEVNLTIKALNDLVVTGKKHFLSPSPDTAARLYRLELKLDNTNGDILPGMFLRANVIKEEVHNATVVPFYSVISRNNEQYVFVAADGLAQKRKVELGIMENWMVQVTHGLQAGETIIVEGHRDVENGQKINVVKTLTDIGNYTL